MKVQEAPFRHISTFTKRQVLEEKKFTTIHVKVAIKSNTSRPINYVRKHRPYVSYINASPRIENLNGNNHAGKYHRIKKKNPAFGKH